MHHQPAGEGLRHFVEVFIHGHAFGETGVGHQQGSRLVESAIELYGLAYNTGNFLRTPVLRDEVEQYSLTTLREKLVKTGAKVVRHGRPVTFRLAGMAILRRSFAEIPRLIDDLRPKPTPI